MDLFHDLDFDDYDAPISSSQNPSMSWTDSECADFVCFAGVSRAEEVGRSSRVWAG
jgi:uncharacterized protein YfaT (DUF1175 family)